MKKNLLFSFTAILILTVSLFGFKANETTATSEFSTTEIQWMTFEEAIKKNKKSKKKIFIDMYTSWCGWCKVMDQKTFTNPDVIRYINENFYAVKFDAEQREPITFKGKKYEFTPTGRKGIHKLAYELMNRSASYPSFVLLDENMNRQGMIKGYKAPQQFLDILKAKESISQ